MKKIVGSAERKTIDIERSLYMKLITGIYRKVKEECERIFSDGYFEFSFLYVPETEKFREIDRFLYESRHTLRFENEYTGNVILDISAWNHKPLNSYFEAFMYFLKDNKDKYECVLIINERCSSEMREKLKDFFGDIKEIQKPVLHESKRVRIGFVIDEEKEVNNVRS